MNLVQKERNIITETCFKEACNIVHNCPRPANAKDPFRDPNDVLAEALLLTKTALKGVVEALVYLDELVPPAKEPEPNVSAPTQSAPARGKAPAQTSTEAHVCPEHGEMEFREGVSSKTGKPYSGWFCSDRECRTKPIFTTVR